MLSCAGPLTGSSPSSNLRLGPPGPPGVQETHTASPAALTAAPAELAVQEELRQDGTLWDAVALQGMPGRDRAEGGCVLSCPRTSFYGNRHLHPSCMLWLLARDWESPAPPFEPGRMLRWREASPPGAGSFPDWSFTPRSRVLSTDHLDKGWSIDRLGLGSDWKHQ